VVKRRTADKRSISTDEAASLAVAPGESARPMRRRRLSRRTIRENIAGYLFLLPWLAGFLAWLAIPMGVSIYLSFTRYNLFKPPVWQGLVNYRELLLDELVLKSLANTSYYTFIGVPIYTVVALGVAVLLNQKVRGISIFRTIYYLPAIVPAVAGTLIWMWIFNPDFGLANMLLKGLGLPPQRWLYDIQQAKAVLIFMSIWAMGPTMVLFLAALQNVPKELTEAAYIDGANAWQRFVHVTFPMISPVTFLNMINGFIASFQIFTPAYIATSGGPANATLFYVLYLFRVAIQYLDFGFAAAMAWLLFFIILVLTLLQIYLSRRWVYYEVAPD